MEALIALGGVALGWGLAELSAWRRRVLEMRAAAKLVWFELAHAKSALRGLAELEGVGERPSTDAWDRYAPILLQHRDLDLAQALMLAYRTLTSDLALLDALVAEQDQVRARIKELASEDLEPLDESGRSLYSRHARLAADRSETIETSLSTLASGVDETERTLQQALDRLAPLTRLRR